MNEECNLISFISRLFNNDDSLLHADINDLSKLMDGRDTLTYCAGFANGVNKGAKVGEVAARLLGQETRYKGFLLYVTGGPNLTLYEVNEVAQEILSVGELSASLVFDAKIDDKYHEKIKVDVIGVK